jgi:aspartyl-tRNA(Asn)/glutamyl-tRNA(Gln) amidotransferase subunit A
MELYECSIKQLHEMLKKGMVSSREITESVLSRIEAVEPKVNAYITRTPELAREMADAADRRIRTGRFGPMCGIPMALKDVLCTDGIRTTCASRILENFVPPYDATVVTRLKQENAVFLGKANMDEFAMGSSTENSIIGPTHNPWAIDRVSGGSSGGSAAAVAADECIAALGTDTGGSIRQPCSHCGLPGIKPTYGRVSRYGLVAYGSSLDQIGPIAKTVLDLALILNVICGYDPRDSTSVNRPVPDYIESLKRDIKGMKLGVPKEYFVEGMDQDVEETVRAAISMLGSLGAEIVEVSLPTTKYAVAAYYIVAPAEASSNLARYDGVKYGYRSREGKALLEMYKQTRTEGFGSEVLRRIMLGTYALSAGYYEAYYKKASQVRTLMKNEFSLTFTKVDALLTPVCPVPAFKIGEKVDDPLQMYLTDVFTLSTNMAGIPGLSVPCGFSREGLPIGLQILGGHFQEETILRVAYNFEQAMDFRTKKPAL